MTDVLNFYQQYWIIAVTHIGGGAFLVLGIQGIRRWRDKRYWEQEEYDDAEVEATKAFLNPDAVQETTIHANITTMEQNWDQFEREYYDYYSQASVQQEPLPVVKADVTQIRALEPYVFEKQETTDPYSNYGPQPTFYGRHSQEWQAMRAAMHTPSAEYRTLHPGWRELVHA